MRELAGRVAVVTGAASGIGLGLATRLAGEGMKVVLADVDEAGLERARSSLVGGGGAAVSVPCDVALPEQVDALAREAVSAFGGVHVVCNNAGVSGNQGGRLWELEPEDWSWIVGVNLLGVVNGIRSFVPLLLEQDEGHVVNTASMAGLTSGVLGPYSVTKHGVVALSESLYFQLLMTGSPVGVSVLCPGWVRTNIQARTRPARGEPDPRDQAIREAIEQHIAAGMDPAEVAGHVVDGIRSGTFYILTHGEESKQGVATRFADILEGRSPTLPSLL